MGVGVHRQGEPQTLGQPLDGDRIAANPGDRRARPIAEELALRGFLLPWLRNTRLGVWDAIAVCAALWSATHVQYAPALLLIFVDGLMLGAARHVCRSIWVPIVMHIAGNLFSISQSLAR